MDNPFENERNGFEPHPPAPQEPVQPVQPAPPVQQPAPEYLQPQNLFEEDPSDVTEEPAPTEEPVPPVQQVQPVQHVQSVQPVQNVPPAFSAEDDSINPIVETGVYDDNRFFEIPTVTIEEAAARAAQSAQPPAKSKVNKGLLVVIIVLSALLGAGMFGIVGYSVLQAKTPAVSPQKEVDPIFPIPDFTWPNSASGWVVV